MSSRRGGGLMRRVFLSWCVGAVAMVVTVVAVPGLHVHWRPFVYLEIAFVWGFVNAVLGTALRVVTAPARVLTLGLISVVINGLVLIVTAWESSSFRVDGIGAALAGAIVLGIVNFVGHLVIYRGIENRRR